MRSSKSFTLHDEEQIIDSSRERGRCCIGRCRIHAILRKNNTDSPKNRGEALMQVAMGAAQSAVAKDEMVKSVVQAYLTGGMAGIQSMVKDKIRDAFIDKVAEATGINPDLVRFATGRFEQAKFYPV